MYIMSPVLGFADDIIFIAMLFNAIFLSKGKFKINRYNAFFPFFILAFALWGFANENPLEVIILNLRQYKNIFLILIMSTLFSGFYDFIRRVFLLSLIISLPMAIYQFLTTDDWDTISGFFGESASGTLSLLIITYFCSELAMRIRDKKNIFGYYFLLLTPIFINETKISFIILPYLVIFILFTLNKLKLHVVTLMILLGSLLFTGVDQSYQTIYGHSWSDQFSSENLEKYFLTEETIAVTDDGEIDIPRMTRVEIAYKTIIKDGLLATLFGHGFSSTYIGQRGGNYGIDAFNFIGTGLNVGSRVQLYQTVLEFGLLGTAMVITYFLIILFKIYRKNKYTDSDFMSLILIQVSIIGLLYQNILISKELSFLLFISIYSSLSKKNLSQL